MKRIFISALSLTLFFAAAQAQGNGQQSKQQKHTKERKAGKEQGHQRGGGEFQRLNLTEAQKTQLRDLREKERAEMAAINKGADGQAQRQVIHQKYKSQFEAILTPEQKAKLSELQKSDKGFGRGQGRAEGGPGGRGRKGGDFGGQGRGKEGAFGRGGDFGADLNLTEAQKAKFETLRADNRKKLDAIRANTSLTQEQKRAQAQEIMKSQQESMKSILTAEQQQKMASKIKERRQRVK